MVMDKVTVHVGVDFFEVCFFSHKDTYATETEGGLGRPVREASSIKAGSDPGGRLRPRGAHAHARRVQGSAAVLGEPVELQDSLGAEGWGTLWTSWSGPTGHLCLTDGGG